MIPSKYLWPVVIIAVGIGFYLFGEAALAGLAALLFGRNPKKQAEAAKIEADEHEQMADYHLAQSTEHMNDAMDSHQDALDIAQDTTDPNDNLPAGFKRKSISSE